METALKWALGICAGLFTAFVLYALYFICIDARAQTGVAGPATEARINEGRVTPGYIETQAKHKPQPAEPMRKPVQVVGEHSLGSQEIVYPGATLTDAMPLAARIDNTGKLIVTLPRGSGEGLLDCDSVQHKWVDGPQLQTKLGSSLEILPTPGAPKFQHCKTCGVLRIAPER